MTENKQEKAEETVKNPAETEQQTSASEAVKIPKKAKTTASEQPSSAKATKKATAIDDIMATVKNMTVLELSELVKALEAEFGVTAAAPMAAATTAATEAKAPAAEEEKTEFSVMLKDIGANKISVIKAVRELTSLGLKESKDLVESAPKAVREGISKEEAATTKQRLETAGATADII